MAYTTSQEIEEMYAELDSAMSPNTINKARWKHRFKIFGDIVFAVIIAILIFTLITIEQTKENGEIPELFGYNLYYVQTGSMEPTINTGAIIYGKVLSDEDKINNGDIVTFTNTDGVRITHRIVQVFTDSNGIETYRTKGDNPNNSIDDEVLTRDRIISKVKGIIPFTN